MRFDSFSFGSIQIEGTVYEHDVIVHRCEIRKRKKKTLQEVPRPVRPHAALARGGNPLAMPPTRHRKRCIRPIARHAGSTARSRASQNQNCLFCPLSKQSRC